jgi:hypothetical protein
VFTFAGRVQCVDGPAHAQREVTEETRAHRCQRRRNPARHGGGIRSVHDGGMDDGIVVPGGVEARSRKLAVGVPQLPASIGSLSDTMS